ncbi:hypothetical protein ACWCPS_18760 [Streptomyces mauvecolor]
MTSGPSTRTRSTGSFRSLPGRRGSVRLVRGPTHHIVDHLIRARLLQNQRDIRAAIATYYGQDAANKPMFKEHITQTIAYSVDLLKGDCAKSITDYDKAEQHMAMLADVLSEGLIAPSPNKFTN